MRQHARGFTLIEVAISMVILGLVLTGLVVALSQQMQQRHLIDTRTTLQQANEALITFVVANARLPCPAVAASKGLESLIGPGVCTAAAGFLPAVTLGLPNLDSNGLLNDGWADGSTHDNASVVPNYPRAIRYEVALLVGTPQANALTTASLNGAFRLNVGSALATNNNGLFVCHTSIGVVGGFVNRCGSPANSLALNVVAVLWSQGPTGNDALGNSADEGQNSSQLGGAPAVARTFVMRDPTGAGAAAGRFDDIVSWVSWGTMADKLMLAWQVQ